MHGHWIDCVLINGKAKSSFNSMAFENHAWNKVYIKNAWYYIDVTFDLTLSDGFIRHDYFLVQDKGIKQTHVDSSKLNLTTGSNPIDYYQLNGMIMFNQNDLIQYVKQQIIRGVFVFEIKIPNSVEIDLLVKKYFAVYQRRSINY